eukprot:3115723-Amphidinium_carterae.1
MNFWKCCEQENPNKLLEVLSEHPEAVQRWHSAGADFEIASVGPSDRHAACPEWLHSLRPDFIDTVYCRRCHWRENRACGLKTFLRLGQQTKRCMPSPNHVTEGFQISRGYVLALRLRLVHGVTNRKACAELAGGVCNQHKALCLFDGTACQNNGGRSCILEAYGTRKAKSRQSNTTVNHLPSPSTYTLSTQGRVQVAAAHPSRDRCSPPWDHSISTASTYTALTALSTKQHKISTGLTPQPQPAPCTTTTIPSKHPMVQPESHGIILNWLHYTISYLPRHSRSSHGTDNYIERSGGCNPSYAGAGKCLDLNHSPLLSHWYVRATSAQRGPSPPISFPCHDHCRIRPTANGEKAQRPVGCLRQTLLLLYQHIYTPQHGSTCTTTPRTSASTGRLLRATIFNLNFSTLR